jgi:hypothetical protein
MVGVAGGWKIYRNQHPAKDADWRRLAAVAECLIARGNPLTRWKGNRGPKNERSRSH